MFLNSTVFGKTFNKFCDFFVTFCEFSYQRNEIIPNRFQIDFLFVYTARNNIHKLQNLGPRSEDRYPMLYCTTFFV